MGKIDKAIDFISATVYYVLQSHTIFDLVLYVNIYNSAYTEEKQ